MKTAQENITMNDDNVIQFSELAFHPELIAYDIDDIRSMDRKGNEKTNNSITHEPQNDMELGTFRSDDDGVFRWSITEKTADNMNKNGFAVKLVDTDDEHEFLILPFCGNDIEHGQENFFYKTREDAYNAFLSIVYATPEQDRYYERIEKPIIDLLGEKTLDEIRTMDFEKYKKIVMMTMSITAGRSEVDRSNDHIYKIAPSKMTRMLVTARYPFTSSYSIIHSDDELWDQYEYAHDVFSYCVLDDAPIGWMTRFGLELCEDLKNSAYDENHDIWRFRLTLMVPEQVKEKFGELRWYGTSFSDVDIIEAYCRVSGIVCEKCGTATGIRITKGYIGPSCAQCYIDPGKSYVKKWRTDEFTVGDMINEFNDDTSEPYALSDIRNSVIDSLDHRLFQDTNDDDVQEDVANGILSGKIRHTNGEKWLIGSVLDSIESERQKSDECEHQEGDE